MATGATCYDADFYPFGGERAYTNSCPQNYKFTGEERDAESGNDEFGARPCSYATAAKFGFDLAAFLYGLKWGRPLRGEHLPGAPRSLLERGSWVDQENIAGALSTHP